MKMHEHLESVTYDEGGEEITYAQPTQEGNPYFQRPIAGFRGENQINRAEAWIKAWSKASGNREKRHRVYIIFDPTQAKSVHNRGLYNPADPNILSKRVNPKKSLKIPA